MPKFAGDLHTHTIASGHAYSTITEMVQSAKARELSFLALTEHGPSLPSAPHLYYFWNVQVLPAQIEGVNVLWGVEANIIGPDGELDLPREVLAGLGWVVAGFHPETGFDGKSTEEYTRAAVGALSNPYVDAIVHPGNPGYPMDYDEVVKTAARVGKAIEINNASLTLVRAGSRDNCTLIASCAARHMARVVINSDSHYAGQVGELDAAYQLAKDAGIADSQITNLTAEGITDYLAERKKRIAQGVTRPRI